MNLLRQHLADAFRHGTPGQRKAIIETHIAEITLSQDKIVPVFRVPQETQMPVEYSTGIPDTFVHC